MLIIIYKEELLTDKNHGFSLNSEPWSNPIMDSKGKLHTYCVDISHNLKPNGD